MCWPLADPSSCTFLLWLFLTRPIWERRSGATAQNRKAAILLGVNPDRMFILAFAIGTGMAGVAGALILPYAYVFPTVGHSFALIMFTVVVLGGFGSVPGALVGRPHRRRHPVGELHPPADPTAESRRFHRVSFSR